MDEQLKNAILHKAMKSGCDSDGDLIWYGGGLYYVHIFDGVVVEQKKELNNQLRSC